jgi:hypothetical protein
LVVVLNTAGHGGRLESRRIEALASSVAEIESSPYGEKTATRDENTWTLSRLLEQTISSIGTWSHTDSVMPEHETA